MLQKISALLVVLTLLCLSSCGNREPASSTPNSTPPSPAPGAAETSPPRVPAIPVADKGASEPKKNESANTVTIDNFTFTPQELTVPVNTTVTWINRDDIPHTVRGTKKLFTSPTLDTDEKFSYTFTEAGTYDYFCTIHTHMTGKIIVK